jgi:AcrR family transcriptional regulator
MEAPARQLPYHHGALREAALSAAIERLRGGDEGLPAARDLAAQLGVTHGALYRHFADKDALKAAVAGEGFALLVAAMPAGAVATPRAIMQTYVDFALEQPGLYRVMFSLGSRALMQEPAPGPEVRRLIGIATEAFDDGSGKELVRDRVVSAWGMTHGMLDLWRSGAIRANTRQRASAYILDQLEAFGLVA